MKQKSVTSFMLIILVFLSIKCANLKYNRAEKLNTIEAYEEFLKQYPEGTLSDTCRVKLEYLYFQKAKQTNTITSFEQFLKVYPKGKFSNNAHLMLEPLYFQKAKNLNSIVAYENFIDKYPDSKFSDSTKMMLKSLYFKNAKDINSIESYEKFLIKYPDLNNSEKDHESLRYIMARRLGELTTLMFDSSLQSGPDGYEPYYHPSENQPKLLKEFLQLLQKGADPNLVRIKSFIPPFMGRIGSGMYRPVFGRNGEVTSAANARSGDSMSLLEYLETTRQTEAYDLLKKYEAK